MASSAEHHQADGAEFIAEGHASMSRFVSSRAKRGLGGAWLARHSTIEEMGPPHRLDL